MIGQMDVTVLDLLNQFREASTINRTRGTWFEELIAEYLRVDPTYTARFSDVWMWDDWPDRTGPDTGIDIVARERDTGGYCAIQCKFYEPTHQLSKADIDSFFTASGKHPFTSRLIVSTTDKWTKHAFDALENQQPPVNRIGLADLIESGVNWDFATTGTTALLSAPDTKQLRKHQSAAIENTIQGFTKGERGKLIMACGTGKTFTSLRLAERIATDNAEDNTYVLFCVPSISLLSQSLREWTAQKTLPMSTFAICSDSRVSKTNEDISVMDLAFPATTNPTQLVDQVTRAATITSQNNPGKRITAVFCTYHSIDVIHQAQQAGLPAFDLILCDEAHRTTGVTLAGNDESHFVKVHDNDYIEATRRLYMTATPRLFREDAKQAAAEQDATLCSMDDEDYYGPEFHRLGFGEAVEAGLLTDYKVLILTVDEHYLEESLQSQLGPDGELALSDAVKIIGCWNGLAKRSGQFSDGTSFGTDTAPMRRAVAFNRSIADSKKITEKFSEVLDAYNDAHDGTLHTEVEHVDGTFNAMERNRLLEWLKEPTTDNTCRILSNAKCLSEGIDVPDLDAVLFLNPRNSQVDVVQSVGRVMRKPVHGNKQYGYIILPVGIPADLPPEQALSDNKRYKVVWQVLQALRAHDDRFNAIVNKIDLNNNKPDQIMVGVVQPQGGLPDSPTPTTEDDTAPAAADADADTDTDPSADAGSIGTDDPEAEAPAAPTDTSQTKTAAVIGQQLAAFPVDAWRDAIYAKIVTKVGERTYWEQWAADVALIADNHVKRITQLITDDPAKAEAFGQFLNDLRATINPGVTRENAIDMLAQHLITKPVFDALFTGYSFAERNPVSQTMQRMLDTLEETTLTNEAETLQSFYASVRKRAEGIDNHDGRQKVITELYERFFKTALPKTADAFGIVYTPIPVVDFILRATNQALQRHFNATVTDKGVQIIDPFTGTGTFIVRLLQSGLIAPTDLQRKYTHELHANEILLLAYYIAAVNIEAAYHQLATESGTTDSYEPFDGIVLTDTFQLTEEGDQAFPELLAKNSERLERQKQLDIRVIIGNPPYSAGQDSANDNNQNQKYPALDARIESTYAKRSTATLKNSLYDSYIRAIRWASDRIGDEGVIGYVSNGGYIDSNTADGLRLSLADEFSDIYCYNLRGNQRTAGELSRKEGGKVFGSGSRSTVAILILVKTPTKSGTTTIHYRDIGDYLTREQKLAIIDEGDLDTIPWQQLTPNAHGDWINQRNSAFTAFTPLGNRDEPNTALFRTYSAGLKTNRDAWTYNYSRVAVESNMRQTIAFYNNQVQDYAEHIKAANITDTKSRQTGVDSFIDNNPKKISWDRADKKRIAAATTYSYRSEALRTSTYRPFTKQSVYFDRQLNNTVYQLPQMFPTKDHANVGFYIVGMATAVPFSILALDALPDLHVTGAGSGGQFFPRWSYESVGDDASGQGDLLTDTQPDDALVIDGWRRLDNITDSALLDYQSAFGLDVTKDDIFNYVYGLLHSPQYRSEFSADLKKMLPRIPKIAAFRDFSDAGRALADLHIGYETVEPYPLSEQVSAPADISETDLYRVQKMVLDKKDRGRIVYNPYIVVSDIPDDAYRYMLGSRSAIEWIIDRYQVKTDKASGIVNDPNDWSAEVGEPRYILNLLERIVTVSIETMRIVDSLPDLNIVD